MSHKQPATLLATLDSINSSWNASHQTQDSVVNEAQFATKSEAELQQYTVDDTIHELDKYKQFLLNGQSVQRYSVIDSLPRLLRTYSIHRCRYIITELQNVLPALDGEAQQHTADVYAQCISEKLVTAYADLHQMYGTAVLMLDSDNPQSHGNVANQVHASTPTASQQAWLNMLAVLMPLLNNADHLALAAYALTKGDVSCHQSSRYTCVMIWSMLCSLLDSDDIYTHIFDHAIATCQDTDYIIRRTMCQHLIIVVRPLISSTNAELSATVCTSVLAELNELLRDENIDVQCAALSTIVQMIDIVDANKRTSHIYPIVKQNYCQPVNTLHPAMLATLAQNIGYVMYKLQVELNIDPATHKHILALYKQLCVNDDIAIRQHCVYHIPCVVSLLGSNRFIEHLPHILNKLTRDTCVDIRRVIALSLCDIIKILGNRSFKYTKDILLTLLRDSVPDIVASVIDQLNQIVTLYHTLTNDTISLIIHDILKSIAAYDTATANKYHLKQQLMVISTEWPKLLADDTTTLYERYVPLIQQNMYTGVTCLHAQLCHTYCTYIKHQIVSSKRNEYVMFMLRQFMQSRNYKHRQLFVVFAAISLQYFSHKWFKKYMYTSVLSLSTDKIPSVRLELCRRIPVLYGTLLAVTDQPLIDAMQKTIQILLQDDCAYVRDSMYVAQNVTKSVHLATHPTVQQQQMEAHEEHMVRLEEESLQNDKHKHNLKVAVSPPSQRKHLAVQARIDTGLRISDEGNRIVVLPVDALADKKPPTSTTSKPAKLLPPTATKRSISTPTTPQNAATTLPLTRHNRLRSVDSMDSDDMAKMVIDAGVENKSTNPSPSPSSARMTVPGGLSDSSAKTPQSWQRHFKPTQLNNSGKVLADSTKVILPKIHTALENRSRIKHIESLSPSGYAQLNSLGPRLKVVQDVSKR